MQLAHTDHRHQNTEAAIVFAAIAHGVVMAACEQPFGAAVGAVKKADHITHRIHPDFVKTAAGAHPLRQLLCHRAVCVGEVSHRQFAALGVAGVTVDRQLFGPIPHQIAQRRCMAEFVVEADLGDAVNIAQALGKFIVRVMTQAALKGHHDLGFVEPQPPRAAHSQDERKAEFGVVCRIERVNFFKLGRCTGG